MQSLGNGHQRIRAFAKRKEESHARALGRAVAGLTVVRKAGVFGNDEDGRSGWVRALTWRQLGGYVQEGIACLYAKEKCP